MLDILEIPMQEPKPDSFQTENWLLDPARYWRKVGSFSPFDLPRALDPVEPLWADGHDTYNGRNDQMPEELMNTVSSSLRLVRVVSLRLRVFAPSEAFGNDKRRVQGHFTHCRIRYALWVTDPVYEREYLAKPDGTYLLKECYLIVSLGEPYGGACYKLVAAIIEPSPMRKSAQ